ncbi:MAG: hypothetical protein H7343_22005 [Undibacterium sp.]|nr:hypothetical protein [Opitutaceae bacterium]
MNAAPSGPAARNNRILVIDDNHATHADVRKVLCPVANVAAASLDAIEAKLLGDDTAPAALPVRLAPSFVLDSAY